MIPLKFSVPLDLWNIDGLQNQRLLQSQEIPFLSDQAWNASKKEDILYRLINVLTNSNYKFIDENHETFYHIIEMQREFSSLQKLEDANSWISCISSLPSANIVGDSNQVDKGQNLYIFEFDPNILHSYFYHVLT